MKRILLLVLFLLPFNAAAFENLLPQEEEKRAKEIFAQVRCMVCEGESIRDSNAQLAVSMREVIRNQIREGASDEEIIAFIKERYGEYALMKPKVNPNTYLLWFGPAIVLLIGGIYIFRLIRSNHS